MKIEVGKRYVRGDGLISGVLTFNNLDLFGFYPYLDPDYDIYYSDDSKEWTSKEPDGAEFLVSEYIPTSETEQK